MARKDAAARLRRQKARAGALKLLRRVQADTLPGGAARSLEGLVRDTVRSELAAAQAHTSGDAAGAPAPPRRGEGDGVLVKALDAALRDAEHAKAALAVRLPARRARAPPADPRNVQAKDEQLADARDALQQAHGEFAEMERTLGITKHVLELVVRESKVRRARACSLDPALTRRVRVPGAGNGDRALARAA
jgi:hypothetical protein